MINNKEIKINDISFTPDLEVNDLLAEYWIRQVVYRLRREICWCRFERGINSEDKSYLPSLIDKESEILINSRFSDIKKDFLRNEPTAKYITDLINADPTPMVNNLKQGSFSWLQKTLHLNNLSCFLLAFCILNAFDSAAGAIIASCQNDPYKNYPTLTLIQRLWENSEEIFELFNPNHPLFFYGIIEFNIQVERNPELTWDYPLSIPSILVSQMIYPSSKIIQGLSLIAPKAKKFDGDLEKIAQIASRIKSNQNGDLKVIPMKIPYGCSIQGILEQVSSEIDQKILKYVGSSSLLSDFQYLKAMIVYCWLKNCSLYFDFKIISEYRANNTILNQLSSIKCIPVSIFIAVSTDEEIKFFPKSLTYPIIDIPHSTFQQRLKCWKQNLNYQGKDRDEIIFECSKSFRFEEELIQIVCKGLKERSLPLTKKILFDACRIESKLNNINFMQKIEPRFRRENIILPYKQQLQFEEIKIAMKSLGRAHYDWGFADSWRESGISILFTGSPGTGKTMAAEIISRDLELPMYKIDLSQVINKYIGETEKNLKKIFDFAEISDVILFFDEADAIFGRRTEIKDAHDRYANITVSYLLERLENFKGLAILATNREVNLDEAFKRRFRYVLRFPMPGNSERLLIWQQVIPSNIKKGDIDFEFLTKNFSISGGNIRSIVFNACLQCLGVQNQKDAILQMKNILIAIKREYDKIHQPISLKQFGDYSDLIQSLEEEKID